MLLFESGDIETNLDPRRSFLIKFCHWKLNGLAAHDSVATPLIEAFIIKHNLRGVCMYYKRYLPFIRRTDISDLQECIVAEITVNK